MAANTPQAGADVSAAALHISATIALAAALAAALCEGVREGAAPREESAAAILPAARALAFPPPPTGLLSPAYLLLLCDKAFAALDALGVPREDGAARAARKAVLGRLQEAERGAEAWGKVYVAPPPSASAVRERGVERVGARVRVAAGGSAAAPSGAVGEVTVDSAVDGRCTVRLEDGQVVRVKPAHLELV